MSINILSFLSAIIWSSLFVTLTFFLRKNHSMKKYYGTSLLLFLYIFGIFRILFPLEFGFTKVISSKKIYSLFFKIIYLNKFQNISILLVVVCVFIVIALYKIINFIILYNKTKGQVLKASTNVNDREKNILNEIKLKSKKSLNVTILKNSNLNTPIGLGLLKKIIILPDKEYTDNELNYILLHEYTHFLSNDVFVKIMTSLFCDIFWWNFIVQLLKKDLEQLLEIKCDLKVVQYMNNMEKAEYLSVILRTLKVASVNDNVQNIGTALVKSENDKYIKERFTAVMNYSQNKKNTVTKSVAVVSIFAITILSYSFILQPSYQAPEGNNYITKENSYIVKTDNEKYILYTNNIENGELREDTVKIFDEMGISIKEELN